MSEKVNFMPERQWPDLESENWSYMDDETCAVRGQMGWAPSDAWSFDHYIAGVIAGGIRKIAEFDGYKGGSGEDWRKLLDEMASGFEGYNAPGAFHSDEAYEAVQKSLKLFCENFGGLWT